MSIEAMKLMVAEMEYVLSCINEDKIPFDGDDFHEALRLGRQAIEQAQKQERCRKEQHGNGEYVCDCKAGECPEFGQQKQEPVAYDAFKDWMVREMPPMTTIGNPEWWAKRIYERFIHTSPPQRQPLPKEVFEFLRKRKGDTYSCSVLVNDLISLLTAHGITGEQKYGN